MTSIPRSFASFGVIWLYFLPSSSIVPESGTIAPDNTLIRVDFPAPFSPIRAWSNLLANEMYLEPDSNAGSDMAETMSPVSNKIVQALIDLSTRVQELVIVTNDVFSDGGSLTYDESTREYVKNLAEINCALAREAATVTEVVCGIPVIVKKNHPMGK